MNDIGTIIDTIVAISTVLTLIVIWLTLKEMKIQRYKVFEPQIFPLNYRYYVLINNISDSSLPKWAREKETLINKETSENYLELVNVGQGVAKDIKVSINWRVRYQEILKEMKVKFDKTPSDIDLKVGDSSCQLKSKKGSYFSNIPYTENSLLSFDYLIPAKESNECIKIHIPSSIELLFSLSFILFEKQRNDKNSLLMLLNNLSVEIKVEYRDNLNGQHVSTFDFIPEKPKIEMSSKYQGVIYTSELTRKNATNHITNG